ncbi:hypothetical protein V0288_21565 [Pannus brasiliensis CCIBt3594]|uniref:DUF2892 domain-containing protein n=1 Tax=Pannus brasiliensis CCIBt3594 TaxID=1427578 RepID=A0AAW9R0M8_9CHRO
MRTYNHLVLSGGKAMTVDREIPSMPFPGDRFDRVRENTPATLNAEIDRKTIERLRDRADRSPEEISGRIRELGREWDTERVLEANASILALTGLLLGIFVHANWFWLTGIVLPFLFQHATQGWCPPLPVIRWMGVRTRDEIDREKYALKVLRGDFDSVSGSGEGIFERVSAALGAVAR